MSPRDIGNIASLTTVIFLVAGVILIVEMHKKDESDEDDHYAQFQKTTGYVESVTEGGHGCYAKIGCNKCARGNGLPNCDIMINSNQTGLCQDIHTICCEEFCYRCTSSSRKRRYNCNYCGSKGLFCNDRCHCGNVNTNPLCTIINGTCYTPNITVSFTTKKGFDITTSVVKYCGLGDYNCANEHINGIYNGEYINIHYNIANPKAIHLDGAPSYSVDAGIIAGYVFGSIFLAIGVCASFAMCAVCINDDDYCCKIPHQ